MKFLHILFLLIFWVYISAGKNLPCEDKNCGQSSVPLLDNIQAPLYAVLDTSSINKQLKTYIDRNVEQDISETFSNKTEDIMNEKLEHLKSNMINDFSAKYDITEEKTKEDISLMTGNLKNQFQNLKTGLIKSMTSFAEELKRNISNKNTDLERNMKDTLLEMKSDNEKNIRTNHGFLTAAIRDMNTSFRTLFDSTAVKSDNQQKKVTDALQNIKSEFDSLSRELADDQNRMNKTLLTHQSFKRLLSPKDCTDLREFKGISSSGVYEIHPEMFKTKGVYCDMTTDGGGWTVLQRHTGGSFNFQRTWSEYEQGFGKPDGDLWLGNKIMHVLTSKNKYELRIDLVDTSQKKKYALYKTFTVGDSSSKYKLTISGYSGDAGDNMSFHNGMKFTTKDQDNDLINGNCASYVYYDYGPWWHKRCGLSALNMSSKKVKWSVAAIVKSVMMIRRL